MATEGSQETFIDTSYEAQTSLHSVQLPGNYWNMDMCMIASSSMSMRDSDHDFT